MRTARTTLVALACAALVPGLVSAQTCPQKNITYWQAFPAGGESDISARHQQLVLKKKCPGIETIIQYKPGAGGGLMWAQMNGLPGDGYNIVGVNLPHIVLQPLEGQVQYKTEDITPVYWYHYTPDAIVVPDDSPIKTFQDLVKTAKAQAGQTHVRRFGHQLGQPRRARKTQPGDRHPSPPTCRSRAPATSPPR